MAEGEGNDLEGQQQLQQQQQVAPSKVTHRIDLEAFAQRFSQIPVVVAYVFSFLSLHWVAALPQRLWRPVGSQITHLVMNAYDTAERRFWCGLSFGDAFEWGRRLTRLRSIVVKYPTGLRFPSGTPDGRKIATALVEGHIEGQRAAAAAATGQQARSTLKSLEFSSSE
ncbi:unnamed protein product [Vitrella brassicaformis CCMP3155]|uniref:Uncharacterized protein n=1 Tax=Vitrella brassicaformis (strain CCMP3155) TaxID=1169540 RepID=A0A0G4H4D5_VITBC|nr:unnamed protein product [Vitrella brassicaformis CCMP3155]|eukprot:CEM38510.1 unnamed protein product [Vitrella brassicaformis CCMP3155]